MSGVAAQLEAKCSHLTTNPSQTYADSKIAVDEARIAVGCLPTGSGKTNVAAILAMYHKS